MKYTNADVWKRESVVDDTTKRISKVGTMSRLHGHEHDEMECNATKRKK
jgi:hypothetical protein